MNYLIKLIILTLSGLIANIAISATLAIDAQERGINSTCISYLGQIEESYSLNGLNITFAHLSDPSLLPSLHISTKNYNNGSSTFSATLSPDGDYCYLSTVIVTSVNNQNCAEITSLKKEENPSLNDTTYADGTFTILTPPDNKYQLILTTSGENGCMMTETRMLWPGK
ncbi:MAG: hypothetical protein AAEF61_01285 [Candidatus Pseudothioglobus sp.]